MYDETESFIYCPRHLTRETEETDVNGTSQVPVRMWANELCVCLALSELSSPEHTYLTVIKSEVFRLGEISFHFISFQQHHKTGSTSPVTRHITDKVERTVTCQVVSAVVVWVSFSQRFI